MTEEDAKTKPCIGPRPELTGIAIEGDRPGKVTMWACRGSACLAWRTLEPPDEGPEQEPRVYCGLAGAP